MDYEPRDCDIILMDGWCYRHFAIVYFDAGTGEPADGSFERWVYEAWPPRVHRLPWLEWEERWKGRIYGTPKRSVYRATEALTPEMRAAMHNEAVRRLGVKYNWPINFALKLVGFDDCSEYIARQQLETGRVTYEVEPSRVTPKRLIAATLNSGLWVEIAV